jgi:hypothetical protein
MVRCLLIQSLRANYSNTRAKYWRDQLAHLSIPELLGILFAKIPLYSPTALNLKPISGRLVALLHAPGVTDRRSGVNWNCTPLK